MSSVPSDISEDSSSLHLAAAAAGARVLNDRRPYGMFILTVGSRSRVRSFNSLFFYSSFVDMPPMNVTGQGSPYPPMPQAAHNAVLHRHLAAAAAASAVKSDPNIKISLENAELWQQFHQIGTEMIITKLGR